MAQTVSAGCLFCEQAGGTVLWRSAQCRVVRAEVEGYPGFLRVIYEHHVPEMTDLPQTERDALMRAVYAAEATLRETLRPRKVNLASYGNQVPHLHWHVVPRFADDPHYPEPPVGAPLRTGATRPAVSDATLRAHLSVHLSKPLDDGTSA